MAGGNDFELLLTSFFKCAENIISHFDNDKEKRDHLLEKLNMHAKRSCINSLKSKKISSVVREVSNTMNAEEYCSEDIMKLFQEKKTALQEYEPDVKEDSNFTDYCRQVQEMVDNMDGVKKKSRHEDDDIEMTQGEVNVIDPFTKKRMTDPVKNKVCGHIYDKESVSQMLKLNRKTKCPVIGCSNKESIDMNNMIPDFVTRKYLHDNPA